MSEIRQKEIYVLVKTMVKDYYVYCDKAKVPLNYWYKSTQGSTTVEIIGNIITIYQKKTNMVFIDTFFIDDLKDIIKDQKTFKSWLYTLDGTHKPEATRVEIAKEKNNCSLKDETLTFILGLGFGILLSYFTILI